MKIKYQILIIMLAIIFGACKKLVEVDDPKNQLTSEKVFSDSLAVRALLNNIYVNVERSMESPITVQMALYTDELNTTTINSDAVEFRNNILSLQNGLNLNIWRYPYVGIYQCNDILNNLRNSSLPQQFKQTIIPEAHFLRAFSYLHLVGLYKNIPLVTGTDVRENRLVSNSDSSVIYKLILSDLEIAKNSLPTTFRGVGKVRANRWAASALLARVHLYQRNWSGAEMEATSIIQSNLFGPLESPINVFKANSKETILQFWTQNGFVASASLLLPSSNTALPSYVLDENLYSAFEPGDLRKRDWTSASIYLGITYPYSFKYRNRALNTAAPEYLTALRLAEQYLIRAEARLNLGDLAGATSDLNTIRNRAGLNSLSAGLDPQVLYEALMKERRVEFFMEFAQRFYDLKRTGTIDKVLSPLKPNWSGYKSNLPIPLNEMTYNPNLIQNSGY